jgi:thiamine biosynthesis lipoprotein
MAAADDTPATGTFRAMGSDAVVVIDGPGALLDTARRRVVELENLWSRFLAESDVSEMNRTSDWVHISDETLTLIDRSIDAWELTSGAFDPTILSSLVAHGYAESKTGPAGRTLLSRPPKRGPAPGPAGIEIDRTGSRVRLGEGVTFDPGGIGKGLAADLVASEAVASGASAAIVSIGGDVRIAGSAPLDWVIAVEDPMDDDLIIAELQFEAGAVCTSSVLGRTWIDDGRTIHHLIDPATGHPMRSSIVSATVVAGEAWTAEALCKAAVIAEPVAALSFLDSAGADGLLVDVNDVVWRTCGIERFAA